MAEAVKNFHPLDLMLQAGIRPTTFNGRTVQYANGPATSSGGGASGAQDWSVRSTPAATPATPAVPAAASPVAQGVGSVASRASAAPSVTTTSSSPAPNAGGPPPWNRTAAAGQTHPGRAWDPAFMAWKAQQHPGGQWGTAAHPMHPGSGAPAPTGTAPTPPPTGPVPSPAPATAASPMGQPHPWQTAMSSWQNQRPAYASQTPGQWQTAMNSWRQKRPDMRTLIADALSKP